MTTASYDTTDYFGVCPDCRRTNGCLNVGGDHWFYCTEHHVRWWVGSNLFSSWRDQTPNQQRAIYKGVFGDGQRWRDMSPSAPVWDAFCDAAYDPQRLP